MAAPLPADLAGRATWERIREEFRSRDFSRLRRLAATVPHIRVPDLDDLLDPNREEDPTQEEMATALGPAFAAAAAVPDGLPTVAALVYGLCLKRWENSLDHESIVAAARIAYDSCAGFPDGGDRTVALLLLDLAVSLASCTAVENALNCSCPVDMQRHAHRAVTSADDVLAALPPEAADERPVLGFVRQAAQAQHYYFAGLVEVAAAVEVFVGRPADAVGLLTSAVETLATAESRPALRDDVYESELRAHRMTLTAMVELTGRPWLRVDEAKIAYCYPFGISGPITPHDVVRAVEALRSGDLLGAARVGGVGPLDVTDAWEANDPDGRAYAGAMATLEDLTIVTTAGETLRPHHVELRVSTLGIGHLRIWMAMAAASAHELNQAVRRGSVQMGAERIVQGGPVGESWPRLAAYAENVLVGFGHHLATAADRSEIRALFSIDRRQHTVLSVRAASAIGPAGTAERLYTHAALRQVVGAAILEQRVNHAAACLEEYVRYPKQEPRAAIPDIGFEGEAMIRHADSTVIVMPTSPNYLVIGYEEMAEFGAALPALLDQWVALISGQRRKLSELLQSIENLLAGRLVRLRDVREANAQVRELGQQQRDLRDIVGEARSLLAFLWSPTLCQTSKYREVLDALFGAAGIARLEADLEAQIVRVEALYVEVTAVAARLQERRTARFQLVVEVTVVFLAATSLAEFFGLVNDASASPVLFVEVAVVILVAAVMTVVAVLSSGRRG